VLRASRVFRSVEAAARRERIPLHAVSWRVTVCQVIRSFRHKGLRQLFEIGNSAKLSPDVWLNMQRALDLWEEQRELADVLDHIHPVAAA